MVFSIINGYIDRKKRNVTYGKMDRFGSICSVANLLCGFILFEIISFVIATSIKNIIVIILLHIVAWWGALWIAHRILPHIVNRIVSIFINPND